MPAAIIALETELLICNRPLVAPEIGTELYVSGKLCVNCVEVTASLFLPCRVGSEMRDDDALYLGSLCQFSDLAGRHVMGVHMPFEPRWCCIRCSRTRAPAHARKHCIDVGYHQVPLDDYDFWCVSFQDETGKEMFRRDADAAEIARLREDPDRYFKVWCEFETDVLPTTWTVWPHSKSQRWCPPIVGTLR